MKKHLLLLVLLALWGLNLNGQTQLITNGNFSSSSGWSTSGSWYISSAFSCYNLSSGYAFAGNSSGQAVINETGDLKQTITIPSTATSATLTFYASKNTDETSTTTVYDYVNVYLLNTSGTQLMQFTPTNINNLYSGYPVTACDGYSFKTFSIPTNYFGQPIQVVFRVHSDGGPKNTMFRIDDVSLTYIASTTCTYSISTSSISPSYSSGNGSVSVTATSGCNWTAVSNNTSWLTVISGSSGTGNGTVGYSYTTNSSSSPRTGTITIAGKTFTVTQAGSVSCSYSISPSSISPSSSTGSGSISVTATSGCSWTAVSNNTSWLTVTSGSSGTGNGTVGYSYITNSSSSPRTGTITIAGNTFTVVQSGTTTGLLHGVDISSLNGTGVSWSSVYSTNHSFAYVRATKGIGSSGGGPCWKDPKFDYNMTSSNPNGVVLGAYHVALPEDNSGASGAVAEANYFYSVASSYIGTGFLPPALDLEDPGTDCNVNIQKLDVYYNTAALKLQLAQWVNTWCDRIFTLTGKWPVLYVTRCHANLLVSYYTNGTINSNIKLWIADYPRTAGSPVGYTGCGPNWNTWPWVFHQYYAPAIAGSNPTEFANPGMDQNVFNGDQTAFNNLIGGTITPPASLDCSNAISLTCGVPYNGTTVGGKSNVSTNGCNSWTDTGPEKVHTITTSSIGDITATLSNLNGLDLDVYILKSCNNNDCFGTVTSNADTYANAPAGTYYILVDGYNGASGSYTLTVNGNCAGTCSAPNATVSSPSGASPLTMTCTATGGSGGTIAYKWYSGTSCSGTVLGTTSSLPVTSSGSYSCKAYISGAESTCYTCATGYATINATNCTNWTMTPSTQSVPSSGGSYQATVSASGLCSYTRTFNDAWIHFTSSDGNGSFTYSVDQNTSLAPRTGTISINNATDGTNNVVTLTITQAGGTCTAPTAIVNSPSGTSPLTMTCTATGGSGGTIAYKWYSGTSCSGTVLGTTSSLPVTSSGSYSCKAYISGAESTCYTCATGYATINATNCTNWTMTPSTQSVPSTGGSYQATVSASGSCSYTRTFNDAWIHFTSSDGNGSFTYSVDQNTSLTPRTGTISINNVTDGTNNVVTLTITQAGGTCTAPTAIVNSPTGESPLIMTCTTTGGSGGTIAYKWYSGTSCSGTVLGTSSTLSVSASGSYSCKAYISGAETSCSSCATGYATINSTTCTNWAVTPSNQSVPSAGGSYQAAVSASGSCSYSRTFNDTWIHLASSDGNGSFTYSVDPNTSTIPRTGTISINNATDGVNNIVTLTITQAGGTCTAPTAIVNSPSGTSPLTMTCTATGGSGGTIAYKWYSGTSCSGTVLGTSSTLSVSASGSYSCKAYNVGYESTCYNCATGIATIGNLTCTNWAVTPSTQSVPSAGGSYQAAVSASGACSYSRTFNNTWIHFTSSDGSGSFTYSVDPNTSSTPRTGTISINNATDGVNDIIALTINQLGTICTTPASVIVTGGGEYCSNATVRASGGEGGTIYWQGTTSNGTSLTSPSTSQTVTSSGTYYFRSYSGNCGWGTQGSASVTISTSVTPSVSISANPLGLICAGQSVIFTATPTNGGTSPSYQWKKNGTNVSTGVSYTSSSLVNADVITCLMTSNSPCAIPNVATSAGITIQVNSTLTPGVSISADQQGAISSGQQVIFTATPTNGGSVPKYQWKVNGINVGDNNPTYTTASLTNGQIVTCVMTSNSPCANPTVATSNSISMVVGAAKIASVEISIITGSNPTCAGESITFKATPVNGGSSPSFAWKFGPNTVGVGNSFSTNMLNNGQVITCEMTSNDPSVIQKTATSNSITMIVNAVTSPGVSIEASPAGAICAGQSVSLRAIPINGGNSPSYQWKRNGLNVSTSPTYSSSTWVNGEVISCAMTSNSTCVSPSTAYSNTILMSVNSAPTPTIKFSGSLLESTPALGYQWYCNNQIIPNAINQTLSPTQGGDYYVIVTNNNCPSLPSNSLFSYTVGNEVILINELIKVYPNPTGGIITIEGLPETKKSTIAVYSDNGKLIMKKSTYSKQEEIDISTQVSGYYLLIINKQSIKIIKK